jgi:hypothetical protein
MSNPGRARRLADYIDRLLVKIPGTRLVDIHRNKVTIVFLICAGSQAGARRKRRWRKGWRRN